MVTQVTSFSRSGLSDWLIQRVTSVILLGYFLCIAGTLLAGVDYPAWKAMHQTTGMRIFTLLAALSMAAHAWIGMWAVLTDYLTERLMGKKGNVLRISVQILCSLTIFVYVVWAVQILWGY